MNSFCTIVTYDHLCYAKTLYYSIRKLNNDIKLHILVCGRGDEKIISTDNFADNININFTDQLCNEGIGKSIFEKYFNTNTDKFRWSIKPVYINYLLDANKAEKIIYVDADICFFGNFNFLFHQLEQNDILLTPHWRAMNPFDTRDAEDHIAFGYLQTHGLFNAGFVGANKKAIPLLEWWAKACLYKCEKNEGAGLWDDQGYLNLFLLQSENIGIVYHKGCNLADWNRIECKRTVSGDEVLINSTYPVIFIHFTKDLLVSIRSGKDIYLEKYLKKYEEYFFAANNARFLTMEVPKEKKSENIFYKLKYFLRIRSRIKKILNNNLRTRHE